MRLEFLILIATGFFILNLYHDGKYINLMKSWKKYYQMAFYAFIGLSLFIFVRKYPMEGKNLFTHANSFIKYMPIDKDSADMITPFFGASSYLYKNIGQNSVQENHQYNRMMNSGSGSNRGQSVGGVRITPTTTKRSVGETKKKFVAANQNWKCADCGSQLSAWFEIDHKIRLDHGGDNHINNLEALCRECHGKKTGMESML
jgi:hypothetical protein